MSKAILVIDMPERCSDCPCFRYGVDNYCVVTEEVNYSYDNRKPVDCPLKPVPKPIEVNYGSDEQDWEKGYNSCLNGILDE